MGQVNEAKVEFGIRRTLFRRLAKPRHGLRIVLRPALTLSVHDAKIGLGVTQNYAEAYYWFAIAASAEIESAEQKQIIKLRDDAASHLIPAVLSREQKRVSEWLESEDGD